MKTIPLTQGKVAIVDDEDFEQLSRFKWYAFRDSSKRQQWRARRQVTIGKKKQRGILMHRQLMGFPPGEVDHKNRDGLDNRRSNLRRATDSQQMSNRIGSHCESKTGFRGVYAHCKKFQSHIRDGGVHRFLGTFPTKVEAALAYDKAARRIFGEFAVLNFPLEAHHD